MICSSMEPREMNKGSVAGEVEGLVGEEFRVLVLLAAPHPSPLPQAGEGRVGSRWSCRHSLREWGCTICRCEACDCVTERRCCVLKAVRQQNATA